MKIKEGVTGKIDNIALIKDDKGNKVIKPPPLNQPDKCLSKAKGLIQNEQTASVIQNFSTVNLELARTFILVSLHLFYEIFVLSKLHSDGSKVYGGVWIHIWCLNVILQQLPFCLELVTISIGQHLSFFSHFIFGPFSFVCHFPFQPFSNRFAFLVIALAAILARTRA